MVADEQDVDIVQEFTAAKLGMVIERDAKGRAVSIHIPSPFIIDQLFDLGYIDREQQFHAAQFIAMRKLFLRPAGTIKTVTAYVSEQERDAPPQYPMQDNDYLIVLRRIRHEWQRHIIKSACDDEFCMVAMTSLVDSGRQRVYNAFCALSDAMGQLLDMKKAEEDRKKELARTDQPWHGDKD